MLLVICSQFYIICIIVWALKKSVGLNVPIFPQGLSVLQRILIITIIAIWFYLGYKYFLSDRKKRNKFIDDFRETEGNKKIIWKLIAFALLLTPVWFLLFIILLRYF